MIVLIVILGLIFLIVLVAAAARLFKPQIKGWLGELLVHQVLIWRLDRNVYRVVSNIMLPTEDGTTQIDHIVVSQYGIFVIETKNYKGWIFGSEDQAQWTQKIFRMTNRFQNPLRQNYKHIQTISELTGIPESYFKTAVVFLGDATFKTDMPASVMYPSGLVRYIRSQTEAIIRSEQVPDIIAVISEWAGTLSGQVRRTHVSRLREKHGPVAVGAPAPACPKCGQNMVLRTRKSNSARFWGCSAYPRCRGIRQAM